MRIFCMCTAVPVVRDIDGAERLAKDNHEGPVVGFVLPEYDMRSTVGIEQYLGPKPNLDGAVSDPVRQHYPNINVKRCVKCGATVAVG